MESVRALTTGESAHGICPCVRCGRERDDITRAEVFFAGLCRECDGARTVVHRTPYTAMWLQDISASVAPCLNLHYLSYAQFDKIVRDAPCRTLSALARPQEAEAVYEYDSRLGDLIQKHLYPVWYVDGTASRYCSWRDHEAHPIPVSNLQNCPDLVSRNMDTWRRWWMWRREPNRIITLHCQGCDRRVVIDGVHWLLRG